MNITRNDWLSIRSSGKIPLIVLFDGIKLNATVDKNLNYENFRLMHGQMPGIIKKHLMYHSIENIDRYFNIQILFDKDNNAVWVES